MNFQHTILKGSLVTLEPLAQKHKTGLCDAISDGELWNLLVTLVPHPDNIDAFIANAQQAYEAGDGLSFAVIENSSGAVKGSTRFMHSSLDNKRTEIGFTFLAQSSQRTGVNTEAKYLMLNYAFETLGLHRVAFVTDCLNQASRKAIMGLGAKEEGVLRNHMVMPNGRVRDSATYSIIKQEWEGVKEGLLFKLDTYN